MSTLSNLKKTRTNRLQAIQKQNDRETSFGSDNDDERFWNHTMDKSGTGFAVIRFLPQKNADDPTWVKYYSYGFKGPTGKWYINNSLRTLDKVDPCAEWISEQWNVSNKEEQSKLPRRRTLYVSNILILKDPEHPENEGKVFLYRYGPKIFEKIRAILSPEFEDQVSSDPYDLWDEGRDFKLRVRKNGPFNNYDQSEFSPPAALYEGDEDKLNEVVENLFELHEFVDEKKFKSYDELKKRLHEVLGTVASTTSQSTVEDEEIESIMDDIIDDDEDEDDTEKKYDDVSFKDDTPEEEDFSSLAR